MTKTLFQSKTFWVNLISILLGLFTQDFLNGIGLDAKAQIAILGVLNLGLRLLTTKPIEMGGDQK